ncbi:Uncharacterised protein [Mycobacterium tuberculosis]|nr:Uncharacterised protein [Mycobacterium tuberculosis]
MFAFLITIGGSLFKAVMNFLMVSNLQPSCKKLVKIRQGLNFTFFNQVIRFGNETLIHEAKEFLLFTTSLRPSGSCMP